MTDAQIAGSNGMYGRWTLEHCLAAQRRLGRRRLALHPLPAHLWLDHLRCIGLETLRRALEAGGFSAVSFHPECRQYSLFEGRDTLRGQYSRDYYRRCVDTAAALGCSLICIRPAGSLLDGGGEGERQALVENLSALCAWAEAAGAAVCVQTVLPLEGRTLRTLDSLKELLDLVPAARAALDTVAASQAGETIPQWFDALGDRICHVCFRDGRGDGGRIWGEGVYPIQTYAGQLARAGYTGTVSLCGVTDRYQDAPDAADEKNLARAAAALHGRRGGE